MNIIHNIPIQDLTSDLSEENTHPPLTPAPPLLVEDDIQVVPNVIDQDR